MEGKNDKKFRNKADLILIGSFVVIALYLIYEHRAHLLANVSYVYIALFILMHLFMHGGHGHHGGGDQHHDHNKKDNQ